MASHTQQQNQEKPSCLVGSRFLSHYILARGPPTFAALVSSSVQNPLNSGPGRITYPARTLKSAPIVLVAFAFLILIGDPGSGESPSSMSP